MNADIQAPKKASGNCVSIWTSAPGKEPWPGWWFAEVDGNQVRGHAAITEAPKLYGRSKFSEHDAVENCLQNLGRTVGYFGPVGGFFSAVKITKGVWIALWPVDALGLVKEAA